MLNPETLSRQLTQTFETPVNKHGDLQNGTVFEVGVQAKQNGPLAGVFQISEKGTVVYDTDRTRIRREGAVKVQRKGHELRIHLQDSRAGTTSLMKVPQFGEPSLTHRQAPRSNGRH